MSTVKNPNDFCRYGVLTKDGHFVIDPVRLGASFREYAAIEQTPDLQTTIELVRALGIDIQAVEYLVTGGVNMAARETWHIHYSNKDKPATQKFDILHELFEVFQKNYNMLYPAYPVIKEPYLSRYADRFAAAVLLPHRFFLERLVETGCDLVKMGERLELSHQCLLVGMQHHLGSIPFVGALYDFHPQDGIRSRYMTNDYVVSIIVKTALARNLKELCGLQSEPIIKKVPKSGSLVCAALYGGYSVLYNDNEDKDAQAVLVRPLFGNPQKPYRIILLTLPNDKVSRFSPQIDTIETVVVNRESSCPSSHLCRNSSMCGWQNRRR
jgi:hypothetical protein